MKGIFLNCANKDCRRMLLKEAFLPPGARISVKCPYCGVSQKIEAEVNKLRIVIIHRPAKPQVLTNEDDDDILMLNV